MKLGDAEWPIMEILWEKAPLSAVEINSSLEQTRFSTNLGTLRTHLRRLVAKGLISQQPSGQKMLYSPEISMEDAIVAASQALTDKLPIRGKGLAMSHFLDASDLDLSDLKELRSKIDDAIDSSEE